ncbi:MAG: nitroreductase family deazaflavin-dependent oxidoreductase [Acidobacteriota bacterium]|nr:nitroreductase family deazaflavin-dependent oxidoreductase [Acidobacteriota bacterium]
MSVDGIPRVEPLLPADAATRAVRRAFATPVLGRLLVYAAPYVDRLLHALARGRFGRWLPLPFASMTTTGAKSGLPRASAVLYFHDGDDVILIASNYGRPRHPAWYYNLRAHPHATLARGPGAGAYHASEVTDAGERERLFALCKIIYPGFAVYRVRTARIGRRIPVMRLRPSS